MEEDEAAGGGDEEEDEDPEEFVHVAESLFYLHPLLRLTAFLHSCIAFSMMVAYYCLKVIIVIITVLIKPLGYEGCFCHFVKWQIHSFISKGPFLP